jgi:hypothetical protein
VVRRSWAMTRESAVQIERVDFLSIPTHDTARALAW